MLYLLAATFGSSFLVIILKMIKVRGIDATAAITVNYIVGAIIAFALAPAGAGIGEMSHAPWFWMSVIMGASFMVSLVVYALSADRSGVAITTISGRAAMAIPVIFAFLFLGEQPTALKIGLLGAIMVSLWLILKSDKPHAVQLRPEKRHAGWLVAAGLPLLVFLLNGVNDTMMQYAKRALIGGSADNMAFTGMMFAASMVTGLVFYFFENRCRLPWKGWRPVWWGALLGITNCICVFGILYALESMDGSVFYPLYYAGAVVISTIAGVWAFKEKLSVINYAGIVIALVAIVWLASA